MCEEYIDGWKEQSSAQSETEWAASDLVTHLYRLETARYGFKVTESYKNKVGMLSARAKALEEEIEKLDAEGENV